MNYGYKRFSGNLILVSAQYPLLQTDAPRCVPVLDTFPQVLLEHRAAACLRQLLNAVGATDEIVPVSGYRSFSQQVEIYRSSLLEHGADFTGKYVAKPGCSEHQTGLAIDLAQKAADIDFLCPDFPDTGICERFRSAASRYGFVQRYTQDKEDITGIACEPWHFRYVGYPHSEIMVQMGFCLEEYIDYLHQFSQGNPFVLQQHGRQIAVYFAGETPVQTADEAPITEVSGNNVDGCVMTIWQ